MILKDILSSSNIPVVLDGEFAELAVEGICNDSRRVKPGEIYVAQKGAKFDGNAFIGEVIQKGVRIILSANDKPAAAIPPGVCYITLPDENSVKPLLRAFYGNPSESVRAVGITGTNGKTTISYLIESILGREHSLSVIGTVNYRIGRKILPAPNTTPGLFEIQRLMSQFAADGVEYCVMEVSSHALDQGRVDLIDFRTAVFTNLTPDHLDYHQTMEKYFSAKAKLFTGLSEGAFAVINADDSYGQKLFSKTAASIVSYGIENPAEVYARDIEMELSGTRFKMVTPQGSINIRSRLVGRYNVYNILAASGACLSEGVSLEQIQQGVETLPNVPGRLEKVDCGQDFFVFIDYAHTPDALENVLTMLRQTSDAKIIVVFGCGGDRDRGKRPQMGKIASRLADYCVITSDNPRTEEPAAIIDAIVEGCERKNFEVVLNRAEAIGRALSLAAKGDTVLIAGKGHENYQIFKDSTISFDEKAIVRDFLYAKR